METNQHQPVNPTVGRRLIGAAPTAAPRPHPGESELEEERFNIMTDQHAQQSDLKEAEAVRQ